MKVITIANRKGGAGKSTCAAHFSIEAQKNNYRTILIDLDPQKTLENWWKARKDNEPELAEISISGLKETLDKLKEQNFDLCVIDTPGDTSSNAIAGISAADLVVIPSRASAADLRAIGRTLGMVAEHKKKFVFVITQAIARSNITLQAASVLSEFGIVAPSSISNRISYINSMADGDSAANKDKSAAHELKIIWDFLESHLFEKSEDKKKIKIA